MTAPTPHRVALMAAHAAADEALEGQNISVQFNALHTATEAAIQAYRAAMEAAGWRMVPRVPTPAQAEAGDTAVDDNIDQTSDSYSTYDVYDTMVLATEAWKAMYDAAPPPEGG